MQLIRSLPWSAPRITALRLLRPCGHRFRKGYATSHTSEQDIFDVVVVGGGPAGLSLATSLRMAHLNIIYD
jgi:NADPH-dependent 2,4-dienoyl-CoA reductase/sulfur reductase-like enzyme